MTALEARKQHIIAHLAEVEDESILQQIEHLLKPSVDFWDELTDKQKKNIKEGMKDAKEGRTVAMETFFEEVKKKRKQ